MKKAFKLILIIFALFIIVGCSSNKETTTTTTTISNESIRDDFKKAMDDYELFIDEYVDSLKKVKNGKVDPSLIKKYNDELNTFNEWNNTSLNRKEIDYYVDVQKRVEKKLEKVT